MRMQPTNFPFYRLCGILSVVLTVVGFVGLWSAQQFREHRGIGEGEFMDSTTGDILVWLFATCFIVGLLVVFPLSLYLQRRAGLPLPGPTLPTWMARLVRFLIVLVIGFMIFLWIAAVYHWLHSA